MFEGSKKRAGADRAPARAAEKWEEFARLPDRLHAGGLRASLKATLEAQERIILEEIAELETK